MTFVERGGTSINQYHSTTTISPGIYFNIMQMTQRYWRNKTHEVWDSINRFNTV